jgi:hypothetical protein
MGDGGWGGVERLEEWMGGSGRPPQRAKVRSPGTPVAPSRDAPISESIVGHTESMMLKTNFRKGASICGSLDGVYL